MKCILVKDGTITRVKDLEAEEKVKTGRWMYETKSQWKNQIYGLDHKVKKQFPANVEGSPEFNKTNEKVRKAEKEEKKREHRQKKISR